MSKTRIADIIDRYESDLLADWIRFQKETMTLDRGRIAEPQLLAISRDFLSAVREAAMGGNVTDISRPEWSKTRDLLTDFSRQQAEQGFTPAETAAFVFSFKQALFSRLRLEYASDAEALAAETWTATVLFDQLGLIPRRSSLKPGRGHRPAAAGDAGAVHSGGQAVGGHSGVAADRHAGQRRTQVVMENLLERIVETGAAIAIIDITGVPTVDTLVAQHLLKTVAAARLMGADCIISGIRPQIAQTIVHLGVELGGVITKATLADAFHAGAAQERPGVVTTASAGQSDNVERIPILKMGDLLLVTIQVDMHDRLAMALQDDLTDAHRRRPSATAS